MDEADKAKAFDVLCGAFSLEKNTYVDTVAQVRLISQRLSEWGVIKEVLQRANVAHPAYPDSVSDGVRHLVTQVGVMRDFLGGIQKSLGLEERPDSIGIDELRGIVSLKAERDRLRAQVLGDQNAGTLPKLHAEVLELRARVDRLALEVWGGAERAVT